MVNSVGVCETPLTQFKLAPHRRIIPYQYQDYHRTEIKVTVLRESGYIDWLMLPCIFTYSYI